jgi:hypothetical protein
MAIAMAPLAGSELGEELAQVKAAEGTLADVVVDDIAALPWPTGDEGNLPTRRAGIAVRTLLAHGMAGTEIQSAVIDLMSDLLHLVDALGLDGHYIEDGAYENYRNERGF